MQNPIKKIWRNGGAAVNAWLSIPCGFSAEVVARQGWDSVTVDMQHGLVDYSDAVQMLTAISATNAAPMVRAPWLEEGVIMKVLDAGARGVICPMVNNREDAERFVSAMRYPPRGRRSFGPTRARLVYGDDYHRKANNEVITMAMIETAEALHNLDDILSVKGLDAIYVGPSDLANSLGYEPQFDPTEKAVVSAIKKILAAAKKHKVVPGIHNGTPDYALKMIRLGFQFVTVSSDARMLTSGSRDIIGRMKKTKLTTAQ